MPEPAPSTLRVALAGAGMVSRHHLIGWSRAVGAEVVAIADPDLERARERAAAFAIPSVYDDVAAMLDAARPDALDVAAPVDVHGALVALAAERGIPVLCQKPLAGSAAEARRIATACAGRTRLMVHENWRFRPHYRTIATWLADGRIGRPVAVRLETLSAGLLTPADGGPPPALARQPFLARMRRLIVMELLVHHLDILGWLFGPLAVETAHLARISPHVAGEDTAAVALRAGGTPGLVLGSMAAHGAPPISTDTLLVLGEGGSIALTSDGLRRAGPEPAAVSVDRAADYQASYDGAIAHFAAAVRTGAPFETPPERHIAILEAVERIYDLAGPVAQR